jgi:thymidylate synthase ThyX
MIAAKAIENNPLFSGQEWSTRYRDFSSNTIYDPIKNDISQKILDSWISFYIKSKKHTHDFLKLKYIDENYSDDLIKTRTFDIARGFLPIACTTTVGWHTNIRQANDHIERLYYHPLTEVSNIAKELINILNSEIPKSFSFKHLHENEEEKKYYYKLQNFYNSKENLETYKFYIEFVDDPLNNLETQIYFKNLLNLEILKSKDITDVLSKRTTKHIILPTFLNNYGSMTFKFMQDYGSFRDLQRHRSINCPIPLVKIDKNENKTRKLRFEQWYLDNLPDKLKIEAEELIRKNYLLIESLKNEYDEIELQYLYPMGVTIPVEINGTIPNLVYLIENRSPTTVHPTLRKTVLWMYKIISELLPSLNFFVDTSDLNEINVNREKQTILVK